MLRHLHDAGVRGPYLERLASYGAMLLTANKQFNLTGAKSPQDLVPHLIDSLSIVPYVRGRLVDIGSGGGLPAIPIAIASGVSVVMIESVAKKAAFLRSALAELGLAGEVRAERAEIAAHDPALRETFDSGTARAVSTAPTVAELLLPFIAVGGHAILQRGIMEERERDALTDAAMMLGARISSERSLGGGRRILILEKTAPASQRFPRRPGVPEKRPLCLP